MKLMKMHWVGIIAASVILLVDLIFFLKDERLFLFLIGIALSVIALPAIIGLSLQSKRTEKINEMFLELTRNLAEGAASGTPVSRSIMNIRNKNYGELSPYIKKLANQVELGIPLDKAFETFANDIDSPVVKRAVAMIIEAEKAGGEIDYILDSTAKSISEVDKLKKERKSAIYNLVVQGYIIFFVFIGIILVMEIKIVPLTADVGGLGGAISSGNIRDIANVDAAELKDSSGISPEDFTKPFLYLLLTQGLFVGLTIGKLTEGTLKSGLKHSFILMIAAFLISSGSKLFLVPA